MLASMRTLILIAAAMLFAQPRAAVAQTHGAIKPTDPRWVATEKPDTPLHCGPLTRFYVIAKLPKATLLRIDGQSGTWARVAYPEGVHPFVPASEAKPIDAKTIELIKTSGLRAPSNLMGITGSWKSVYEVKLPAGTRLTIERVEKNTDGEITGYAVVPPTPPASKVQPYAFVKRAHVRDATAAEIDKHTRAQIVAQPEPKPTEQPTQAEPAVVVSDPEPEPVADPTDVPATTAEQTADSALSWSQQPEPAVETNPIHPAQVSAQGVDTSLLETMGGDDEPAVSEPQPGHTEPAVAVEPASDASDVEWTAEVNHGDATQPALVEITPGVKPDASVPAIEFTAEPTEPGPEPALAPAAAAVRQLPTLDEFDAGVTRPQPAQVDQSTPAAHDTAPDIIANSPGVRESTPAANTNGIVDAHGIRPAKLEDLEATFRSARQLDREQLDDTLDELLAEYTRAHDAATHDHLRRALKQRINWLTLRAQLRDQRRQITQTLSQSESTATTTTTRIEQWQTTARHRIETRTVGRLERSRVYNGVRLPLMYRLRARDAYGASHTIGYVRPAQQQDLSGFIDQLVTIRGQASYDENLRTTIIDPEQVEPVVPETP